MSRATKNSSTGSSSKEDESPILPVNLVPGLNSGTVFTLTEDQLAERARLEADFFREDMAQRAAALEILRLRNQRSAEEIAFLKDNTNFTFARVSASTDSTTVRDQPPPSGSGVAIATDRSSTIIKECEKELVKNLLQVSAPGPSFLWVQKLTEYINYGGSAFPWNFLHPRRKNAFEDFLSDKEASPTTCEVFYNTNVYTRASECLFLADYKQFIIDENAINPGDYLAECAMDRSGIFDGTKIRDYLGQMRLTVDMFDGMGLSNATAVKRLVQGLQPWAFRDFILKDHPEIYSCRWGTAVDIITKAFRIEQDMERKRAQGYGSLGRAAPKAGVVRFSETARQPEVGSRKTGDGVSSSPSPSPKSRHTNIKPDEKPMRCTNCQAQGHTVSQCDLACTRCVPSCGQRPSRCPVYLRHRDVLSSRNVEREKQMSRAYKSNNSRASSLASSKVFPSSIPLSPLHNHSGRRASSSIPPPTTTRETTAPGPPSPDDLIIDFGCNGNFFHSTTPFDKSP